MISRVSSIACLVLALCTAQVPAQQQACAELTISGNGRAGGQLVVHVNSDDGTAPAFLALSGSAGSTRYDLGAAGSLTLGLAQPIVFLPIGTTNQSGVVNYRIDVPLDLTTELTLFAQAFTVQTSSTSPRLEFCTSDIEQFTVGG